MWDEKVVIRLCFFCFVWYLVIFSCICTVRNRGWGSVLLKKNWEKFGGYRYYSYICNHKSKINKDFYEKAEEVVCEYRLFFLYDHRILDGCFWGSLKAGCFGVAKTE